MEKTKINKTPRIATKKSYFALNDIAEKTFLRSDNLPKISNRCKEKK